MVSDVKIQSKSEEVCASSASSHTADQLEEKLSKFMSEQPEPKLRKNTEQTEAFNPMQRNEKLLTDSFTENERQFNIDDVEFVS